MTGLAARAARMLDELDEAQRRAATTLEGPVLVLAGAGSGKTRTVTARTAALLAAGAGEGEVLTLTFTNKAARELRERLAQALGPEPAARVDAGTFHAWCLRLLRQHGRRLGLPARFALCDSADQLAVLRNVLNDLRGPEGPGAPRAVQARISLWKNRLVTPERALALPGDDADDLAARAYGRYEAELRRRRALDFDDLLLKALELLDDDEVAAPLRRRLRWVQVDEYQDTNLPQYELLRRLVAEHRNLCVVGDDDQSIYAWRGADHRRILGFERDFPGATVIRLETNYRSTPEILEAAAKVVRHNRDRHDKDLRSALGSGRAVEVFACEDEEHEAEFVVGRIAEAVRRGEERPGAFAVLFRTALQPRPFETELRLQGIPYRMSGSQSFFDRKEVRDLAAFLRLTARPDDEAAFLRVLNVPPRGIGASTVDKVVRHAAERGTSAPRAFRELAAAGELPAAAVRGHDALQAVLDELRGLEAARAPLSDLLTALITGVDYRREVERLHADPRAREARWDGALELLDFATAAEARHGGRPPLETFLDDLSLRTQEEVAGEDDARGGHDEVVLSTIHAAKGLEFPRVFLVGCEEGLLPHRRAVSEDGLEEERRLAYVAITRARESLCLTFCRTRTRQGSTTPRHPSRFVLELRERTPPEGWVAIEEEIAAAEVAAEARAAGRPSPRHGRGGKGKGAAGRGKGQRRGARGPKR